MGEMLLTELGLYNARPTLRVDGQQNERIDRLLRSMVMSEQEGGQARRTKRDRRSAPRAGNNTCGG